MGSGEVRPYSVSFLSFGSLIASSRLRAEIPQAELTKIGVRRGTDMLVYGKHILNKVPKFAPHIFDVCDDHFNNPTLGDYYRLHVKEADAVTCNSEVMREIVSRETGRDAVAIPDPYESEERPADMGYGLLWYGHESNLKTILPYMNLGVSILSGRDWSRDKQLDMLEGCAVVLIPTDERKGKSANRMIEAIRNGRFVVAGELPAHDEFKDFMWVGDITEGVTWALQNRNEAIARVKAAQDYIREKYSPAAIARQWLTVLDTVWQQATAR